MTLNMCLQKTLLFGIGGILLIVGVLMASLWPFVFKSVLKSQLALTKGSKTYDMWVETPMPMYIDIYLFNWTNSHEVKAKPVLQEIGPYVFSEKHYKVKVGWNKNGSITYRQARKWIFHPELSNGSLSDNITNLNVIAVTIGDMVKNVNIVFKKALVNLLLWNKEQLIVTKNVSQLLFEGYTDPVLEAMDLLKNISIPLPKNFDKFGWFYKRNMSDIPDGVFTMNTGVDDIDKLGDVVTWNGKTRVPFYSGSCGKVEGSLGELWSPSSSEKDYINLFAFDMCGSLPLHTSGLLSLFDLSGRIFSGGENVFDNGTKYPESACYCQNKNSCHPSGIRNVSQCRGGAPVFISYPHFYLADPVYRNAVEGLNPDSIKHSFNMALEEKTGVPMQVEARLQISLLTEPIKHMENFYNVPRTYMPMIWFNQHARMTENVAQALRPLSLLASYGCWVLVSVAILGLLLVLSGLFLKLNNCWGMSHTFSQSETLLTVEN